MKEIRTLRIEQSRVRFAGFDILKFLCTFLIVCIHCPFPGAFGQYFTAFARIGVPIFFMITGYFYSDIVERNREGVQVRKIVELIVEANLLYLAWNCFYAVISGNGIISYLTQTITAKNMAKFVLLNVSPFNGHLWYLGAILYVLLIMAVVDRLGMRKVLYIAIPILLTGDLVLGKYSILLLHREFPYIFVRNFLYVGLPYFCIGILLREIRSIVEIKILAGCTLLFSMTTLLERYCLISVDMNPVRDHYISTTFLAITAFLLFREFYQKRGLSKIEKLISFVGWKYSTWIYIIHPIFITALSVIAHKLGLYGAYQLIAPVVAYIVSIVFVAVMSKVMIRVIN